MVCACVRACVRACVCVCVYAVVHVMYGGEKTCIHIYAHNYIGTCIRIRYVVQSKCQNLCRQSTPFCACR